MDTEDREELLQRSRSFGRTHSWCLNPDEWRPIDFLEELNVNAMAEWSLPLEYLQPVDAVGDASVVGELHQTIDALLTSHKFDPALESALKAARQKLFETWQMLLHSRIDAGRLPLQALQRYLKGIHELSSRAQRGIRDAEDIAAAALVTEEDLKTGIAELERLSLVPRFREELLPDADLAKDAFKQGWKDEWWRSGQRQRALEILDVQNHQWALDDEREHLAVDNRELLLGQFSGVKARLEIADELGHLTDPIPKEVTDNQLADFITIEKQYRHYRELALTDVQAVERLLGDLIMRDADATAEHQKTQGYVATFLPDNRQRLDEICAQIKALEDWYAEERRYRMYTEEGLKLNAAAMALQCEVERLRAVLREKEEELQREADLWAKRQQEAGYFGLDTITEDLDERYEARHGTLVAIRTLLELEREDCERQLTEHTQAEEKRRAEVQALLRQLEERRQTLRDTAQSFQEFADTSLMAHQVLQELRQAVDQYVEITRKEGRARVPSLLVEGLKIGARMDDLIRRVDSEKCARIASVDTTMQHLTLLLEFSVDTYDPNAHKFQAILDALIQTRRELQEAVQDNAALHEWLIQEVTHNYKDLGMYAPQPTLLGISSDILLGASGDLLITPREVLGRPSSADSHDGPAATQCTELLNRAKLAYPGFFSALDDSGPQMVRVPSSVFQDPPASRFVSASPRSRSLTRLSPLPGRQVESPPSTMSPVSASFPSAMSWTAHSGSFPLPPLDPLKRPPSAPTASASAKRLSPTKLRNMGSLRNTHGSLLGNKDLNAVPLADFDHREFLVRRPFH